MLLSRLDIWSWVVLLVLNKLCRVKVSKFEMEVATWKDEAGDGDRATARKQRFAPRCIIQV